MISLVVRPESIDRETHKVLSWCLQLRRGGMPETEYHTLLHDLHEWEARELTEAGSIYWLFGDPRRTGDERQ
jgi:hypothetical protein